MKRTTKALAAVAGAVLGAGSLSTYGWAQGGHSRQAEALPAPAGLTLDAQFGQFGREAYAPRSGQLVVDWNKELVKIEQTPGAQPATIHPTRSYALLQTAIYDAVVSITQADDPYAFSVVAPRPARADAAADQAAHDVLTKLFPTFSSQLDTLLSSELGSIPAGAAKDSGLVVGARTATLLLALRANDGSTTPPPPFKAGNQPGDYQLTPPNAAQAQFTGWGNTTPWVLTTGDQFRPPAPPLLSSAQWAAAINQVESLGQDTSTTRTPDQTTIAQFWAPPIWNTWNEIAESQAIQHRSSLEQASHVFAALDLSLADTAVGFYDAKYHYQLWRPVTAIRAGTPGNSLVNPPNTSWLPQAHTTAPDPSYPAAHATESEAAATVLSEFYGDQPLTVSSDALSGTTRSFNSFQAAANEAGLSRIFAGQHTSIDVNAGDVLGHQIADFVLSQPFGSP
ncbi:MAG TPA: vanadium-dependent haloperoxidase [Acidimicrobiales bacterium]|nr:vanadium-dependent haloperoxidase [Acidimicrobiales bacterium]